MRTNKWDATKYKAVQDMERKKLYSKESNQKHSHCDLNKFDLDLFCKEVKIQLKKIRKVKFKEETKKINKSIRKMFVVKRGLKVITIEIKHEIRVWG